MSISAVRTVTVTITDDEAAVAEFMAWQMTENVFPIRGTVTAGLGGWFGTFDGDDERDLMHYFATRATGDADLCAQAADEVDRLRRWKVEATEVIRSWEDVWVALGQPGELGESKAVAALRTVLNGSEAPS